MLKTVAQSVDEQSYQALVAANSVDTVLGTDRRAGHCHDA
jgi:hypothetical protein